MKKIVLISLAVVFVALCFVFNKFDLNISIALTKYDGAFFEIFDTALFYE